MRAKHYVPSAIRPHLDRAEKNGLIESLTVDQLCDVVIMAQVAYQDGRSSTGAEVIDRDAIWHNGLRRSIEHKGNGLWQENSDGLGDMSVEQAVEHAAEKGNKVTARGIRKAAKSGYIKYARKIGRDWVIPVDGLDHYLDNRPKRGPKPANNL
jgi:hypothetical protein